MKNRESTSTANANEAAAEKNFGAEIADVEQVTSRPVCFWHIWKTATLKEENNESNTRSEAANVSSNEEASSKEKYTYHLSCI